MIFYPGQKVLCITSGSFRGRSVQQGCTYTVDRMGSNTDVYLQENHYGWYTYRFVPLDQAKYWFREEQANAQL